MKWLAVALLLLMRFAEAAEEVDNAPGQGSFDVPEGVEEITVELWGAGGRGGDPSASGAGGGGGGGGFTAQTLSVEPGETYSYIVGAGGDSAAPGGDTLFLDASGNELLRAEGGANGTSPEGAVGGDGDLSGGDGGDGEAGLPALIGISAGGGGGSSAGPGAEGNDGQGAEGGASATGNDESGAGGDGGGFFTSPGAGSAPGGGGGGGSVSCFFACDSNAGAEGADGQVRITYADTGLGSDAAISYWFDSAWGGDPAVPDRSGNGNTGNANGVDAVAAGPDGAIPGSPGTCGFASVPLEGNITAPSGISNTSDSFTMSFWMRMPLGEQNSSYPLVVGIGSEEGSYAERGEIYADLSSPDPQLVLTVQQGGSAGQGAGNVRRRAIAWEPADGSTNNPFGNEWVHIAVTHDMDSRSLAIHANGSEVRQASYGDRGRDSLQDASGPIQIGGFSNGRYPASLDVDEFRYFTEGLPAEDIRTLAAQSRACATGLAGFRISVASVASVCAPENVTVEALNSNGDRVTDYSGLVNLSTSSGDGNWGIGSGEGALTPSPDDDNDGAARYQFSGSDEGRVQLTLSNRLADQLTVSVADNDANVLNTSDPVQFRENVIRVQTQDPLEQDIVAGRDHGIELQVIGRDDSGECGLIEAYDQTVPLKAWLTRGSADPGGAAPAVSGSEALPDDPPPENNLDVSFDQGEANLELETSDVGQYSLNMLDDSSGLVENANGDPLPVGGQGPEWTVRPFGFDVAVVAPENPGASEPSGDAFNAAGRPFDVSIRAVQWQSGDDTNDDGQPDGHGTLGGTERSDLSGNETAGTFGVSDPLVALSSTLVAPAANAVDPGLAGTVQTDTFSNGESTVEVRFEEVGSIDIQALLEGSYLGRSVTVQGRSGYVGRFHPEAFTAQVADDGAFTPECNGFVYSGQPHGYDPDQRPELTIVPRGWSDSGQGQVLENYQGDWQKLTVGDIARNFPSEDLKNSLPVDSGPESGRLTPLGDGTMLYQFRGDEFTYTKNQDARIAPFDSNLTLEITGIDDGDAQLVSDQNPVSLNPAGVELRYGRLQIGNAYGPETQPLTLPMTAQYWTENQAFERNTDESCWTYNTGDAVSLSPENFTSVAGVEDTLLEGKPLDGSELVLEAPGEGNTGDVRATFEVPVWLQDDFSNDGELENPSGLATFGVYRGHDRIIYWREVQ